MPAKLISFFCLFSLIFSSATAASPFRIMTEELPPYNYQLNGIARGHCVEMLLKLMAATGHDVKRSEIEFFPWARGYHYIQRDPNTILFSMARTPEREKMFKWVGPITDLKLGLIALKKKAIAVSSPKDLKNYQIGTIRSSAPEQLLLKRLDISTNSLVRVANPIHSIKQLVAGRIDLFCFNVMTAMHIIKSQGLNQNDFEVIHTLKDRQLYFAFNKATDDTTIAVMNKTFAKLKEKRATTVIKISGHPDYPPFMWKQGKRIVGVGPDLAKIVCEKLGIPYSIEYTGPWKRVLENTRAGTIDLIVGAYKNNERQTYMDYTESYATNPISISVLNEVPYTPMSRNDLIGKTGITMNGDSLGQDLDIFIEEKLDLIRAQNSTSIIRNLLNKRVDYILWGNYPTRINVKRLNVEDKLQVLEPALSIEHMYMTFSQKSIFRERIDEVNAIIKQLKDDGTVEQLLKKNLKKYAMSKQ